MRARRFAARAKCVLCLVLATVFAVGYVPSRPARCRCTAAHNCGCHCWSLTHPRDCGSTTPSRSSCCATRSEDPERAARPPLTEDHERQVIEFLCPEHPVTARGMVAVVVRTPSRTCRDSWFGPVPHGPPREQATSLS